MRGGPGAGVWAGEVSWPLYEFPVVVVTKHHNLGGLKQLRLIRSVLEARSPDRGVSRAALLLGGLGGSFLPRPSGGRISTISASVFA